MALCTLIFFSKLFALDIWFFKPFKKFLKQIGYSMVLPDQQCEPEEGRLFNGFVLLGLGLMIVQKSVFPTNNEVSSLYCPSCSMRMH